MSEQKLEQKVLAYICRFNQGLWQLLVFDHDKTFPDAGVQIPGGTVEKGEALQVALEREIFEESGLQNLMIVSQIDQYDFQNPATGKTQQRHVFLALAPNEERDQWTHHVKGSGEDSTLIFHFRWMPIAQARHLSSDQGRSVRSCIQLLFERQDAH